MKRDCVSAAVLTLSMLAPCVAGPLDPPPGNVSATGKTLNEIEPSVPIGDATTPGDASARYVIDQPGTYHLTDHLVMSDARDGIEIRASHVTIDLRGFKLDGAGIGDGAVRTDGQGSGRDAIELRNGHILNWSGTAFNHSEGERAVLENLSVSACGNGLSPGAGSRVVNCAVFDAPAIFAAFELRSDTIARDCVARDISGTAFQVTTGSSLSNCIGSNAGNAFVVSGNASLENCHARNCQTGFTLNFSGITATSCTASGIVNGPGFLVRESLPSLRGGVGTRLLSCSASDNFESGFDIRADGVALVHCASQGNEAHGFDVLLKLEVTELPTGVRFEGCSSVANGMWGFRVRREPAPGPVEPPAGLAATFDRCVASRNTGFGFVLERSELMQCFADHNGNDGFFVYKCKLVQSSATMNADDGFNAEYDCELEHCRAAENESNGFILWHGTRAIRCTAVGHRGGGAARGFLLTFDATAMHCESQDNETGFRVQSSPTSPNVLAGCISDSDGTAYSVESGNKVAPIQTDISAAGPWDNLEL